MQYNLIESNIDISSRKANFVVKQYAKLSDIEINNSKIVFQHLLTYFNLHLPENKKLTLQFLPAITVNNTIDVINDDLSQIVSKSLDIIPATPTISTSSTSTIPTIPSSSTSIITTTPTIPVAKKHIDVEDYIATLSPNVYHRLYKELAILAEDYLKLLDTFHKDLLITYNGTIKLIKDLLKHFSWHDINLVLDIISDVFSLLSVIPVPPLIILSPIFAVVAVTTRILAQLDYQKIYEWFINLIKALEKYIKKNLDPLLKRIYHKIF